MQKDMPYAEAATFGGSPLTLTISSWLARDLLLWGRLHRRECMEGV